jgi:predicted RNA binding protein YcfA (HicA-like mRNA interferase family)
VGELRDIPAKDAIRAFERAGGIVRKGKGSHVNIRMPNGASVTFAQSNKDVKIGLLRSMLKRAELSQEAFLTYLGRKR